MTGRPPNARVGEIGSLGGRSVIAGVAPFQRLVLGRHPSDLWSSLEVCAVERHGLTRLNSLHGSGLTRLDHARFSAFLRQARQYFETVAVLDPVAKPLTAYYFALNLTKAYLTVVDPNLTRPDQLHHGLNPDFDRGQRYSFKREAFKVRHAGVFRMLAGNTGMKHCWAPGYRITVDGLLPYLSDGFDLYGDSEGRPSGLVPVKSTDVLFSAHGRTAWLQVQVDRNMLKHRKLTPEGLLGAARVFGSKFRLVNGGAREIVAYESKEEWSYSRSRREVLQPLSSAFDSTVLGRQRAFPGGRQYITLSQRSHLLSHESVTFAVLHHLSNVVRYRPMDAERLLGGPHFWLLASWIDRASEGLLLALASRITGEEHLLV